MSGALGGETGGTEWEFYATGHSLGGFLAAAVTIELDPDISKCARAVPVLAAVLALACCVCAVVSPAGSPLGHSYGPASPCTCWMGNSRPGGTPTMHCHCQGHCVINNISEKRVFLGQSLL